jgi:uncharacterized protein (DUF302 family)
MTDQSEDSGIIRVRSAHDSAQTIQRLEAAIRERALTIFATIRFSEDAIRAGIPMRFTQMIVFGNPRAGSPVIVASPTSALDLPLKALVAEDPDGSVWLSCNDPVYLQQRHHVPPELAKNIGAVEGILREVAR